MKSIKDEPVINAFLNEVDQLFTPAEVESLARESGFVQRKSLLTGYNFLSTFVFNASSSKEPLTLEQLCGLLHSGNKKIDISRQSLDERFNAKTVEFLRLMLSKAMALKVLKGLDLEIFQRFNRIILLDSTGFQLSESLAELFPGFGGGASKAGLKIQWGYDLQSSEFFLSLHGATTPDQSPENRFSNQLRPGDLRLQDLGYSVAKTFSEIEQAGAYYLSRLSSNIPLYQLEGPETFTPFDSARWLQSLTQREEISLWIKVGTTYTQTRLVAEPVPEKIKEKRLRTLNKKAKEKGSKVKKKTKIFQGFSLYISNAPHEKLPATCFRLFYGIRWGVELIFKNWKSNFYLDELPQAKPHRILCTLYAKLIFILLTHQLVSLIRNWVWLKKKRELSLFRASKHFVTIASKLGQLLTNRANFISEFIDEIHFVARHCIKSVQNTRIYPLEIMDFISRVIEGTIDEHSLEFITYPNRTYAKL